MRNTISISAAALITVLSFLCVADAWAADPVTMDEIRTAYREGRDGDVVVLADRALKDANGDRALRGELNFWRGAALRRLKRHEEALVALDVAHDLGFARPELQFERAVALLKLGKQEEADRAFQEAEKSAQEDPPKLEDLRRRWREARDQDQKFQLRLYPQLGYDTNAVGVSDDAALAEDVDRESFYYGLKLSARYLLFEEKDMSLVLHYQGNLRAYAEDSDLSYSDNVLSAIWNGPIGKLDWLSYEIRGSMVETYLTEDGHFRTQRVLAPALIVRPDEAWQIRLWADWTSADYYEDVPDAQDRDGGIYRGGLSLTVDLGDGWKIGPYLSYSKYNAEGSDYDHHSWNPGVQVTVPEFAGILLVAEGGVIFADYDNPHSLTGFTEARDDRRVYVRLNVTFKQLEKVIGFAPTISVAYENWSSNISAFDFDRWDFGFSTDILALSF